MPRHTLAWGLTLVVAAGLLALTPLFALLGYESSFVLALVIAFAGAHHGAATVARRRDRASRSDGEAAEARPLRALLTLHLEASTRGLALLALPLALLAANALRIRNCNLAAGLAWFALLPGITAIVATATGIFCGLAFGRRPGLVLALLVPVASVIVGLGRFYAAPPIFAYDPFAGYFAGTLYDEAVAIGETLLWARALHLAGALAVLLVGSALLDGRALRLRWASRRPLGLALAALAVGLVAVAERGLAPRLHPDAADLARALGGRRDTAHLTLLYSPRGPWAREIDLVAADAELRWSQLARTLGVEPRGRITAYLFDHAADKERLLGASHTQIAKPWRREIYLQHDPWPHPVIKHELAHVFAGEFGDPVFAISRRGATINVGLIEGAAVAADDRPERLDLDQQVKIMRLLGVEPRLEAIFGLGFLTQSGPRAYLTAGSFCRFLLATRGAERFRALYRSGGDFPAAYGVPWSQLAQEWSARIDDAVVSDDERELARERLLRPSVFHKVCAHELAVRRSAAHQALGRGDTAAAIWRLQSVCRDDPDDPANLLELLEAQLGAREEEAAMATGARLLAHPKATDPQRARVDQVLGDRALRRAIAAARPAPDAAALYERALARRLDEGTARQLRARRLATSGTPFALALGRYLVGDDSGPRDGALDLYFAEALATAFADQGLGHYLVGRQLALRDRGALALPALETALARGLPDDGFTIEARRLAGTVAARAGQAAVARPHFAFLASRPEAHLRREAADWLARLDFVPPVRP